MTWNFRLVNHSKRKSREVWYGVHEVFYTESGKPWTMTQDPVSIDGESPKDVLAYLRMIQRDLKRLPVLDAQKTRWAKLPREGSRKKFSNVKSLLDDLKKPKNDSKNQKR